MLSGTSAASPVAAGVAALAVSYQPGISPDEIEAKLVATAQDYGAPGRDDYFGFGMVNAADMVDYNFHFIDSFEE